MMELFPAIDLRDGRCVRLRHGDYEQETRYSVDPVDVAVAFAEEGSPWIHVVDLDAARGDGPVNRDVIGAIAAAAPVPIQVGGGVRDDDAAKALFDLGVERVVVGTAAVRDPALVQRLVESGLAVAVGLDVRGGEVAVDGWLEGTGRSLGEMLDQFADVGAAAAVITFIERDGTLEGPDLIGYTDALTRTGLDVIASGGVGSAADIADLASLKAAGRGLRGVIVGKALHDGVLTVGAALAATRGGKSSGEEASG